MNAICKSQALPVFVGYISLLPRSPILLLPCFYETQKPEYDQRPD
jgi:hypothetical protein